MSVCVNHTNKCKEEDMKYFLLSIIVVISILTGLVIIANNQIPAGISFDC